MTILLEQDKQSMIKSLTILGEGYYEQYREDVLDEYIEKLKQDIAIILWSYMLIRLEKDSFVYPQIITDYYLKEMKINAQVRKM